ncbi:unnamed protein product [Rhizoctonia solani]|uniref:MATE efflux family protein n=1 Tax=Rhizoctonia solani TaxID=456999 RepID=A0A8H2XAS5_9AGAM|nr:unnamed protein product [Rhizoctonia solani]
MSVDSRETEPLLSGQSGSEIDEEGGGKNEVEIKPSWAERLQESKILLKYTAPVYTTHLLEHLILIATMVSIGHLSLEALAASALGGMMASLTGWSIAHGFASALDSLLPQAWTSEHQYHVGLWTQRMIVLMGLVNIPILCIWHNAESVLLVFHQEPEIARLAAIYLKWLSIGLPAYCFNIVIRRYFQAQGIIHVSSQIIAIIAPVNALLNWLLVWGPQPIRLGFIGGPIATAISFNLISIYFVIYGIWYAPRSAWHPISSRSFHSLGSLLKLGLAGVGQVASSWWSWTFVGFMASQFGPVALATHIVLLSSASTSYQGPYSLSVATPIRIGNLLGAGQGRKARITAEVSLCLSLLYALCVGLVFFIFRKQWGYMFNSDEVMVRLVSDIMPLVAVFQIADGMSVVSGGALRARGRNSLGALISITGFYVIGIPLGVYLAFSWNMGLFGLWIGLASALWYSAAVSTYVILRTDWVKEGLRVCDRLEKDDESPQEIVQA